MTQAQEESGAQAGVALAVDGGTPVRTRPMRTTAPLTDADRAAAMAVLESDMLAGPNHPVTERFEAALAAHAGVPHALAVNSGTAAIHCILQAMGVGRGDEVIVPAHTFIATATPVLMAGATPVVVDIEAETYCLDPKAVADAVTSRTKAVVAVHINGHPAPVDQLPSGIPVISDACQAQGATLFGTPVGALGIAGAYSFWQDKLITAGGEGGVVLTADAGLADEVRSIRSHAQQPISGTPDFHHVTLGYNYRLTGVQSAIGHSQLERLPDILDMRLRDVERLAAALVDVPGITLPVVRPGARHVFWKFVIAIEPARFDGGLRGVIKALRGEGIPAVPRYPVPLSRQPVMTDHGRIMPCPVAESLSERLIMLPLPAVAEDAADIDDVGTAVRKVVAALAR